MTESRFYVVRGDVCPACGGSGKIRNEFFDLWENFPSKNPDVFWQKYHQSPADLEPEIDCRDCAGTGEIRSETTLAAALSELGVSLPNEVQPKL
jgi:hypothetical protein